MAIDLLLFPEITVEIRTSSDVHILILEEM